MDSIYLVSVMRHDRYNINPEHLFATTNRSIAVNYQKKFDKLHLKAKKFYAEKEIPDSRSELIYETMFCYITKVEQR